jgi:diadenylate cyclase
VDEISNFFEAFSALMKTFSLFDMMDIFFVGFIIYGTIKLVRETRAWQLVKGVVLLVFAYFVSIIANFKMLNALLGNFFQFAFLVVLIIFQPEIRNTLERMGRSKIGGLYGSFIEGTESVADAQKRCIADVVNCVLHLQTLKTGALIAFERQTRLGEIINSGTVLDAKSSPLLIHNIFFSGSPLHDGAIVIREGRIHAAGCVLPLSESDNISVNLGTRHRAAIGLSENSDAVIVVVSEENGIISVVCNRTLKRNYKREELKKELELFILSDKEQEEKRILPSFFGRIVKR